MGVELDQRDGGCGEELWEAVEGSITQSGQSNDGSSGVLTTLFWGTREVSLKRTLPVVAAVQIDAVVIVALHSHLLQIYCSFQFKSSAAIEIFQFLLLWLPLSVIVLSGLVSLFFML